MPSLQGKLQGDKPNTLCTGVGPECDECLVNRKDASFSSRLLGCNLGKGYPITLDIASKLAGMVHKFQHVSLACCLL